MSRRKYNVEDYIGVVFGEYTVIGPNKVTANHCQSWWCKCSCGNETWVALFKLNNGTAGKCRRCSQTFHDNSGPIPSWYYNQVKKSAERKGREFSITIEDLNDLWIKSCSRCALSGLPLNNIAASNKDRNFTASLDRIDSSKGYIKENIQWVHKTINRMKTDNTDEDFIQMCVAVAKHQRRG